MNFYKVNDEQIIDLDRVISVTIIDLPTKDSGIVWALLFEINVIDQVKLMPNKNIDESEVETAHCQVNEYFYASRLSNEFETLEDAEEELDKILKLGKSKC